ncbi:MAG: hypothetical protein A2Y80_07940 [Deltaproteobacteria bacterium RBG_13_58_19]|nr:MAG: hypothetical protein A2Y80_07940 [Deltaproteobacteria bacterium RBG_13_58_19]
MKICILGNINGFADEAQKNITRRMSAELSRKFAVTFQEAKENLVNPGFWKNLRTRPPDIIHVFLRPTLTVLLYVGLLRRFCRQSKVILSALQPPGVPAYLTGLLSFAGPHLLITSSDRLTKLLARGQCPGVTLYGGVDREKFQPVSPEIKAAGRRQHQLPLDRFLLLHVGHPTPGRNLGIFTENLGEDVRVVLVLSRAPEGAKPLIRELKTAGCLVLAGYRENLQELYQLADGYVFPTLRAANAVGLPLSVLEAMACNLPVLSTRFGALPELFAEDPGFRYFDGTAPDLRAKAADLRAGATPCANREKTASLDWRAMAGSLEAIYHRLLQGGLP